MPMTVPTRWKHISLIVILCVGLCHRKVLAVNPYSNVLSRRRSSSSSLWNGEYNNRNMNLGSIQSTSSTYRFIPDNSQRSGGRSQSEEYDDNDDDDDDYDLNDEEENRLGMEIKRQLEQAMERSYGVRPWSIEVNSKRANDYSWTTRLVTMNAFGFFLQCIAPRITQMGIKRSELILQGKQLHRLVTPIALHGNFIHLLMNTYSLQNIGPEVERMFGPRRFLATYLISGITGNILSSLYTPNPSLGASGAIFGLVGAYYAFLQHNGVSTYIHTYIHTYKLDVFFSNNTFCFLVCDLNNRYPIVLDFIRKNWQITNGLCYKDNDIKHWIWFCILQY